MELLKKVIYRVNREWFRVDTKNVVGDMYWHFQVADDSRTTNLDELRKNLLANLPCEVGSLYEKDDEDDFPIYVIEKANAYYDISDCDSDIIEDIDKNESNLIMFDIDGQWESVESIVCCSKEHAQKVGVPAEYTKFLF